MNGVLAFPQQRVIDVELADSLILSVEYDLADADSIELNKDSMRSQRHALKSHFKRCFKVAGVELRKVSQPNSLIDACAGYDRATIEPKKFSLSPLRSAEK